MGYYINGNSRFMKIAVSDGSFGPRGMIAYTTWSNTYYGYPEPDRRHHRQDDRLDRRQAW